MQKMVAMHFLRLKADYLIRGDPHYQLSSESRQLFKYKEMPFNPNEVLIFRWKKRHKNLAQEFLDPTTAN